MTNLVHTCPSLKAVSISLADLSSIKCTDLPPNLVELCLSRCEIPVRWFDGCRLVNLTRLHLDRSPRADYTHIRDLMPALHNLQVFSTRHCYRIDDRAIEALASDPPPRLSEIYLDETAITQYSVQLVCGKLAASLTCLSILKCKMLTLDVDTIKFVKSKFNPLFKFFY